MVLSKSEMRLIVDLGSGNRIPTSQRERHFVQLVCGEISQCGPREVEWNEFWKAWKLARENALASKVAFPCVVCGADVSPTRMAIAPRHVRCVHCQTEFEASHDFVRKEPDRSIGGSREESMRMPGGLWGRKANQGKK